MAAIAIDIIMLNKNTQGAKRRGQSEADYGYIAILATESFDVNFKPRIIAICDRICKNLV